MYHSRGGAHSSGLCRIWVIRGGDAINIYFVKNTVIGETGYKKLRKNLKQHKIIKNQEE
jgi:hypothetical protein